MANAGRIRAVLFDLDGTLYAQLPLRLVMACEMGLVCVASLGRGGSRVPRVVTTFRKLREELRGHECAGEPLGVRQYSIVSERLRCSREDVERVVEEWIYQRPLKWLSYCRRAGLLELLQFLDARGIHKGVFSDYPAHEKLAALGLASHFDLVLSSVDSEIGAFKPDPRGYAAAAAKWGLPPSSVLYIGDRMEIDAPGAVAAGMPCAVLTRDDAVGHGVIGIRDFKELQRVLSRCC